MPGASGFLRSSGKGGNNAQHRARLGARTSPGRADPPDLARRDVRARLGFPGRAPGSRGPSDGELPAGLPRGSGRARCWAALLPAPGGSASRSTAHGAERRAGADGTAHPLPGWGGAPRAGRKRRAGSSGTARGDEAERTPAVTRHGRCRSSRLAALGGTCSLEKKRCVRLCVCAHGALATGTTRMGVGPGWSPAAPPPVVLSLLRVTQAAASLRNLRWHLRGTPR